MKVVVTGSAQGIGKGIAELFLQKGHSVVGVDRQEAYVEHENYTHIQCDVRGELPEIPDVEILVNNAGTQNGIAKSANSHKQKEWKKREKRTEPSRNAQPTH